MLRSTKAALLLTALTATSADATQGGEPGFWVVRDIRQGMTEAAFNQAVVTSGWKVTAPFGEITKGVVIDGTNYWLLFCEGRLTYASWLINDNSQLIQSMNARINNHGFRLSNFTVSSKYSDSEKRNLNEMRFKLQKPGASYSVTYFQYDTNSQISLEDSDFDDSLGCDRDRKMR